MSYALYSYANVFFKDCQIRGKQGCVFAKWCHNIKSFAAHASMLWDFVGAAPKMGSVFTAELAWRVFQANRGVAKELLPAEETAQKLWVLNALQNSTRGMSRSGIALAALDEVMSIVKTMVPGAEGEHLNSLFTLLDHRGSDVRLETGSVLESSRQAVPYPASSWKWETVQCYHWKSTQHINILELAAFFKPLKYGARCAKMLIKCFFMFLTPTRARVSWRKGGQVQEG